MSVPQVTHVRMEVHVPMMLGPLLVTVIGLASLEELAQVIYNSYLMDFLWFLLHE